MSIYHFCAPQFLEGIKSKGLVLGSTPIIVRGRIGFAKYTQWLTVDGSFAQSWNGRQSIKYDRCAHRLEIHITEGSQNRLLTWKQLKGRLQIEYGHDCIMPGFDDPEFCNADDWRIYAGVVPPTWIGEIVD